MTPARAASTVIGDVGQRPVRALIIAIDPAPIMSAYVAFDGTRVKEAAKLANHELCDLLPTFNSSWSLVIEQIASYGMPVGAEIFETCVWTGRFMQRWDDDVSCYRITRLAVKSHLCHSGKASDANIRQALIDRFGGKECAIGKKHSQGPLYGIKGDCWSALAVAVTWWDQNVAAQSNASVLETLR